MLDNHVDRKRQLIPLLAGVPTVAELCSGIEDGGVDWWDGPRANQCCHLVGSAPNAAEVGKVDRNAVGGETGTAYFGGGILQGRSVPREEEDLGPGWM
ncbi:hypothetical protein IWX62_002514 [Arthrobacter sp. CAN_A1]